MTVTEVEAQYRRYIHFLNTGLVHTLGEFVHEDLTYNGEPMTRAAYQDMIAAHMAAVPDLFFHVDRLVVQGHEIACRINFECTPTGEFFGLPANGRPISFSEHVFYRLEEGRIRQVWSLVDRPAIERQLRS